MKLILSLIVALNIFSSPDIKEIRRMYPDAKNSESAAKELSLKLAKVDIDCDKTLVAYKGASITLLSKFSSNIADKVANFKEGSKLVELAVAAEPNNVEIRMIRLSIQENIPKIVNYRKNKKEDKDFILAHYKEQPNALKTYLKAYILQSKSFSLDEKQSAK